jgi:Gliding motility associated protein GldN
MKKVFGALFFAYNTLALSAQYEQILKNPDVIWASEIDMFYDLRPWSEVVVINKDIKAEEVYRIRLREHWFWDERQQRLVIQLSSFAPLVRHYDLYGDVRFERPLFYR